VHKTEPARAALKIGNGNMWKDMQLRDYRKANGLCFKCGEKFDPTHQCARPQGAALHALTTEEESPEQLSKKVLYMLELQDLCDAPPLD
jgi:hypothetical protein